MKDPIRPTDDDARVLARQLLDGAGHGALGTFEPGTGAPMVTRVAVAMDAGGAPVMLISDLSLHARALREDPRCSLLAGEPGPKGDALTWPRLTLQAKAEFVPRSNALRQLWLERHPKAALYVDFADFNFVRLAPLHAHLNGGFGKAYRLEAADLLPGMQKRPDPKDPAAG